MENIKPNTLEALFKSNACPTPCDVAAIEHEIASRKAAIENHQLHMKYLALEREKYQALLAPLRRLPSSLEIISEIFNAVLATVTERNSISAQLLDLCLVCKDWRNIALSTPRLWSNLSIALTQHQDKLRRVRTWVKRAGSVGKRLRFDGTGGEHAEWNAEDCPLNNKGLANILARTPNIEHVSLKCRAMSCFQNFIAQLVVPVTSKAKPSSWDTLQSLELEAEYWDQEEDPDLPEDQFLQFIPSVPNLTVSWPPYRERLHQTPISRMILPNVTSLMVTSDWDPAWLAESLGSCTRLENLTIDFMDWGEWPNEPHPIPENWGRDPKVLPNLKTLRMLHMDASEYEERNTVILRALKAPCLEELDFSFFDETGDGLDCSPEMGWDEFRSSIVDFLALSGRSKHLRRFRLHHIMITSEGLIALLNAIPSVTHLILDEVAFPSRALAELTFQTLPDLEVVDLLNVPTFNGEFRPGAAFVSLQAMRFSQERAKDHPDTTKLKVKMTVQREDVEDRNDWAMCIPMWVRDGGLDHDITLVDRVDEYRVADYLSHYVNLAFV